MLSSVTGTIGAHDSLYRVIIYSPDKNSFRIKEGAIKNMRGNRYKPRLSMAKDTSAHTGGTFEPPFYWKGDDS